MDDWEKAGEIARKAREYGKTLIKENATALEVADKVEQKIEDLGAFPAFPTGVSINHIAAHCCPLVDEKIIIKKGDVIKLDLGAHINGSIADTACTVEVNSNQNSKLIEASQEALKAAADLANPGTQVKKVGAVIDETIIDHGFNTIKNLSGHLIQKYVVHGPLAIPNYDNGDKTTLEEGKIIAIEPFSTTGVGKVSEGKYTGVYMMIMNRPVRDIKARKLMGYIDKEFKGLPFSIRWLKDIQGYNFSLRLLEKQGILKSYPQLVEDGKGLVSQTEHTIRIGQGILT